MNDFTLHKFDKPGIIRAVCRPITLSVAMSVTLQKVYKLQARSAFRAGCLAFCTLVLAVLGGCARGGKCSLDEHLYNSVARERGLEFKQNVPCRVENSAEMQAYLKEEIVRSTSPERFAYEGRVYKLLGFVPPDFDYIPGLIEIFSNQLEGYYDPAEQELVLARNREGAAAKSIASHELTHALQDQHFGVRSLLDKNLSNDAMLVRSAVLEGDATLIAAALDSKGQKGEPICNRYATESVNEELARIVESSASVPVAIKLLMSYPYLYGPTYLCKLGWLSKKSGEESKRFWLFPRGTRELRLFAEGKLDRNILRSSGPDEGFISELPPDAVFRDVMGEFSTFALLAAYLPYNDALSAQSSWKNDELWYLEGTDDEPPSLVWRIQGKDSDEARKLFQLLKRAYEIRFRIAPQSIASDRTLNAELLFSPTTVGDVSLKLIDDVITLHVVDELEG